MSVLKSVLGFVLVSLVIYTGLAFGLAVFGKRGRTADGDRGLSFDELLAGQSSLPELTPFKARDGSELLYRLYPASSDRTLILLHGSGWHSRYFLPLADFLASEGLARVVTPDLRGHGPNPGRRGDVDYIAQLEDDLADLVSLVRTKHPDDTVIVGGHSSGGGLAVRFAGSRYGAQADAFLLLSPYLKYNAPTMRSEAGGWALPHTPRIIGLSMLNNVGIHWLDHLTVIEFNMPERFRDGTETLAYSHRLNTAYAPRNYKTDLQSVTRPVLVAAGTGDEAFLADRFEETLSPYVKARFELLPGVSHMGVVTGPEIRPVLRDWLSGLENIPHAVASTGKH
jgi:alpha-beta hydrolase superfamily lysophospholipase